MKLTIVIFFLQFFFLQKITAQSDTLNLNHKYLFGSNLGLGVFKVSETEYFDYNVSIRLRSGYFLSSHILAFVGFDGFYKRDNLSDQLNQQYVYSVSPGVRYYFTRSNRLFAEAGIQYGKFDDRTEPGKSFRFFQAGVGGGLNFLLYQGFAGGRFMFEFVIRQNVNISEKSRHDADFYLGNLGTSFGINYVFPALKNETPIVTLPTESFRKLHSIKFSIPNKIAYSLEVPLYRTYTLGGELTLQEFLGIFNEAAIFIPGIKVDTRNYYGFYKRQERGQITTNHSSDFLSLVVVGRMLYTKNTNDHQWQFAVSPRWGLRRALGKNFIFEATVGASLVKETHRKTEIMPHAETAFGYVF